MADATCSQRCRTGLFGVRRVASSVGKPSLVSIRTAQHTGHPHVPLERGPQVNRGSAVAVTRRLPANRVRAATSASFCRPRVFPQDLGRVVATVLPDNTTISNLYWPNGLLQLTYGSRNYPAGYGYDYRGRLTTLTNWSGFANNAGARLTTWNYHPQRGWLNGKTYHGNTPGPTYQYTGAGRLRQRIGPEAPAPPPTPITPPATCGRSPTTTASPPTSPSPMTAAAARRP